MHPTTRALLLFPVFALSVRAQATALAQPPAEPAAAWSRLPDVLFDSPRPDELWAIGHDWKASFDPKGTTFVPFLGSDAPCNLPLRIELATVQLGERRLELGRGQLVHDGKVVTIHHGPVHERLTAHIDRLEQDFVFSALPDRAELAVEIELHGAFTAQNGPDGVRFRAERGGVDYSQAKAVDAAGHSLDLTIAWNGERARIVIPAAFVAEATLPLVLDPLLQTRNSLAPGVGPTQGLPDIATVQQPDKALVCWQRDFSATDQDVYAMVVDYSLQGVTTVVPVDVTSQSWSRPRVAAGGATRKFLVVAQVGVTGSLPWIGGRLVDDGGFTGAALDVDRAGVNFGFGSSFAPDVGGDPHDSYAGNFVVVFEKQLFPANPQRDVQVRVVGPTGVVGSPLTLRGTSLDERAPAIAKANRTGDWLVCWQTETAVGNRDIEAAHLAYDGSIARPPYTVSADPADETNPAASSPADIDKNGAIYAMFVWEKAGAGGHDLAGRVVDSFANLQTPFDLTALENAGNQGRDQTLPHVDSDGTRFVVGYTESSPILNRDTYATTIAFLPAYGTVRIDEPHAALGHAAVADESITRIAAWSAGDWNLRPVYAIAGSYHGTNDLNLFLYGGHGPGAAFTTVPTQCGTAAIAASGHPTVGNTVVVTVPNAAVAGIVFGYPGAWPLFALLGPTCNCTLGAVNGVLTDNPLVLPIPNTPYLVGTTFAAQGYAVAGTACLGFLSLSDTVQFTIR